MELPSENCSSVGLAETWHPGTHPATWGHLSCLLFFSFTDRLRKAHWPLLHLSFSVGADKGICFLLMPSSVTHNGQRTLPEVSRFVRFPVLQNLVGNQNCCMRRSGVSSYLLRSMYISTASNRTVSENNTKSWNHLGWESPSVIPTPALNNRYRFSAPL